MTETASWRGGHGGRRPVVRHRWQREQPVAGALTPYRRGSRARIALWLAVFLLAVGFFVYFLLFLPVQTPLIAVVAGPYQWPYPPNAWAREDLDGLSPMDGQTLTVVDTSAAWQSVDGGLHALAQQLRESREQAIESGVVMLSISAHGAVNATGAPCLVPPQAAPHNAQSWLPVRRLLDVVRQSELPPDVNKLIILDANRMLMNWNIGLLENSFAARLEQVVADANIPNLVILNSAGPGQRGWSAPELQGSVFGHYLRRGLAGAADGVPSTETRDGRVSLHELHAYLRRTVDAWVRDHRGARQQPLLVPSNTDDFQVVWSLNGRRRDRLENRAANVARAAPAVSSDDVTQLWRRRDALPAQQLARFDPIAWHQLQHDLLWLEQAALAGGGYEALARQTYARLESRLDRLERIYKSGRPTISGRSETSPINAASPRMPVHHLPLAALFGDSNNQTVTAARAALADLQTPTTVENLSAALRTLVGREQLRGYDQIHFARLMAHYQIPQLWQTAGLMATVFKTRGQAVRAAINSDERVQFWTDAPLASADSARRRAEDLLFLGPHLVKDDPSADWNALANNYASVIQIGDDVAEGLRVRDRGWATVPYYAEWLMDPLHHQDGTYELEQTLLPLIENLHRLSLTLAAGPDAADQQSRLSQTTGKVRQQLETLEQQFQSSIRSLLTESHPTAEACREIFAILHVPLATAEQREQLSQKLIDFSGQMAAADRSAAPRATAAYGTRLAAFYTHPALAMLNRHWLTGEDSVKRTSDPADRRKTSDNTIPVPRTAEFGEHVRALLATLPAEFRAWGQRFAAPANSDQSQAFPFRAGWPQAELTRIAASFSLPRLEADPVEDLRKRDLQRLLLRQSQRVLDDFYGPDSAGRRPFFEIAAGDYLRAAETIVEPAPEAEHRLSALRTLLETRSRAAQTALRTAGSPILFVNQTTDVSTHLSVEPRASAAALPPGRAAVFLRDGQGRISGSIHPLNVPLAGAGTVKLDAVISGASFSQVFPVTPPSTGQGQTNSGAPGNPLPQSNTAVEAPRPQTADSPLPPVLLSAVTLFRGNEFRSSVPVDPAGGYLVEHKSETYPSASVELSGTARQQLSVVFVLDCSSSMSEAVGVEAPRDGDRAEQTTRMAVAKDALNAMLDRLAKDGDTRVGVWFYGHRVGWSTTEPTRILRQVKYARTIPDGLSPNRDVEAIQHLGRFDDGIAAEIENLLPSIKPWGQTPLYYALVQALQDFSGEDPNTKKIVIVITDGLNYQYNDPNPTTQSDVLAAWSRQQAPIYIVGFGIPAQDADEAYEQFTQLAKKTGGDYHTPAVSATALINSVESLLSPGRYQVNGGDGKAVGAAQLDAPIDVDALGEGPQNFVVASNAARQPITLWGGEALRLLLDQESSEIRSVHYDEGNPSFVDLVTGTPPRPTDVVLGVHRPRREPEGVRFTVSIQRADNDFTPRPAESWIEITPVFSSEGQTASPVVLYDQQFEPHKPVPVLSWLVRGWPAGSDRARIRFWCKPQATEPTIVLDAKSLLDEAADPDGPLANSALEGISLTAHPIADGESSGHAVLQVIEQHSVKSAAFDPLKITAILGQDRPGRVTRRIDPDHRLVVHQFAFDGVHVEQLADVRLQITTREDLRQNAWQAERPVQVEISDVTGLVEPTNDPRVLRPRLLVK